jgi:hypothetical protein
MIVGYRFCSDVTNHFHQMVKFARGPGDRRLLCVYANTFVAKAMS